MTFDPSIAAQRALRRLQHEHELGADLESVLDAEAVFSSTAGPHASAAFHRLHAIGDRHPSVRPLQEFLIFITWQQLTEETIPQHCETGVRLCERYLAAWGPDGEAAGQVAELHRSFRAALGLADDDDDDYDADVFKGGD
ncbi:hypothetical protein [Candidatus Nitrospira bockiana]